MTGIFEDERSEGGFLIKTNIHPHCFGEFLFLFFSFFFWKGVLISQFNEDIPLRYPNIGTETKKGLCNDV